MAEAHKNWEESFKEDLQKFIEENGLKSVDEFFKAKLVGWRDVEVKIAITGRMGSGKSSFINRIRGLKDKDKAAAPTDVDECTSESTPYDHPTNHKIKFYDLPGTKSTKCPDIEVYCKEVELEKYDVFLLFSAGKFCDDDLQLAKIIKSFDKKFFFIRSKIDIDVDNEKEKHEPLDGTERVKVENTMLEKVRSNALKYLRDEHKLVSNEEGIFLISTKQTRDGNTPSTAKWDFPKLTRAIVDALPRFQKESLMLTLNNLTTSSNDIFKEKVEYLKGRAWVVALKSAGIAAIPLPGLSPLADTALILDEISFYRSQLGLPEEGTVEFERLNVSTQGKIRDFILKITAQGGGFVAAYATQAAVEEATRFCFPFVGLAIASAMSFGTTYVVLKKCLQNVEELALLTLKEAEEKSGDSIKSE